MLAQGLKVCALCIEGWLEDGHGDPGDHPTRKRAMKSSRQPQRVESSQQHQD